MALPAARLAWTGTPPGTPPTVKRPSKNGESGALLRPLSEGGTLQRSASEGGTLQRPSALASSLSQTLLPDRAVRHTSLQLQDNPELELQIGEPEFEEENQLIRELRAIFDWMAQEKGATVISHRKFTHRLPELHRRMPQIASSFRSMDRNGDGRMEWSEFSSFCLKEVSLMRQMKRTSRVSVYAKERNGQLSHKEAVDPTRMCDVGTVPPLLPWEMSHVIEWRIDSLSCGSSRGGPIRHGPLVVRPGTSLASPPFRGAGVCGFLRFWPSGYWSEAQRRLKIQAAAPHCSTDAKINGPHPMPSPDAWCCVSCVVPAGTHLVYRFFAGDQKSEKRECFFHEGNFPGALWSPVNMERPVLKEGDSFTVGIEIFRNLGATNGNPQKRHKQQGVKDRTPFIRDTAEGIEAFKAAQVVKLEDKSMSLPALPSSSTWRNLDKLLQAYRRDSDAKASSKDKSGSFGAATAPTLSRAATAPTLSRAAQIPGPNGLNGSRLL